MPQPTPEPPPLVLRPRHRRQHYRCSACGYGATLHEPPLHCPICGRRAWVVVDRHPEALGPEPDRADASGEDALDNRERTLTEATPTGQPRLKTYKL